MSLPHNRKRPNNSTDEQSSRACDQCRSRKVRCDRQQPECSNCRKAGVTCDFSDMLRRVNYAKRLHDEFSSVSARVDKLEASVAKLPEQIAQILSSPSSASNAASLTGPSSPRTLLNKSHDMTPHSRNTDSKYEETSEKWQPHFERIQIAQGGERIVGYPAALTLFVSIKRHLMKALTSTTRDPSQDTNINHYLSKLMCSKPFLLAEFQKHYQAFPFNGICNDPAIKSDG
ncbi:conserved hypothetical protein [Talaromyces stipitatus ATCC 10500]|uniref:Zn(2)-C6 fungal-type domain-containing protein n=1 Tax=Talaromyces stipitatus (strain ATCC 10500 / CBS 375.48 / QM 6759 / NRRL 1006) TaxID=441959 RepID=B8M2R5_TALSN|nr:uncharacterized protein TSTA_094160 [Talaromyces stipitatus ATCC 10500]EED22170.1 conserved hypothetical protein [Talaromyces stipitatus ATCC 10500]